MQIEEYKNKKIIVDDGKVLFEISDNVSNVKMLVERINQLEDRIEELEDDLQDWEENGLERLGHMLC